MRTVSVVLVGIVVAVAVVVIWALLAGVERTGTSDVDVEECLIVTPGEVQQVGCDEFGAQRVVAQLSGAQVCPAGANSLLVGSTTWCLVPADS